MNYKFRYGISILLKYIALSTFVVASIGKSIGQDVAFKPKEIKIYFQSISYSTQKSIASNVVIYDTYYHKIDSIAVPQGGLYLNLPKIDLIFKVRSIETGYKPKGQVLYVSELIDTIKIIIDPKGVSRCPIILQSIFFDENSSVLDSTAISELLRIKKQLLLSDDSTHCFNVQLHSHVDFLEMQNASELLRNRANAVKKVLMQNNSMNIVIYNTDKRWRFVEYPKSKEDHAQNRCVAFKVSNLDCSHAELIIKE
ncbi:MAG TPA: hypothetical protein VK796_01910 [Cytophaga sp.]|nr:hypothetical protein [Cytophaga sp.]